MKKLIAVALVLLASCDKGPQTEPVAYLNDSEISGVEAEQIFDYAYPLVLMHITQDLMFTVPFRDESHPNQFIHFDELAKPKNQAVVLANRNTLYSVGWLDLSRGPVVFEIPDMAERYYVMPLLDAWTNTFRSIGSRTTGQGAQKYLVVNDAWQGEAVVGMETIVSPTNMVWITGRIQADSEADAQTAAELQQAYSLMTYEQYIGGKDPFIDYEPTYAAWRVRKPVPYSLELSAVDFYDAFFSAWQNNSSATEDTGMLKLMQRAGIQRHKTISFNDLAPQIQQQLRAALSNKQQLYRDAFYKGRAQIESWIFNREAMGTWGTDYQRRAYWAMWGLGANLVEDAVYGVSQLDGNLQQLNGSAGYKLHFDKGALPPSHAFWSITNYDNEGYLSKNELQRYSLGSNHPLTYNADGSLDIYLLSDAPSNENINWVPAPKGNFKVLLRIYWPKEAALNGSWVLPPIEKLASQETSAIE